MIDSSLYIHIKETRTAAELWTKLKSFDDFGFTRKISLLRTLISMRLENCDGVIYKSNDRKFGAEIERYAEVLIYWGYKLVHSKMHLFQNKMNEQIN